MSKTAVATREAVEYFVRQFEAESGNTVAPTLQLKLRGAIQGVVAAYERDVAEVLEDIEARYRAETSDPTAATKADGVMRAANEVAAGIDGYVFRAAEQPNG